MSVVRFGLLQEIMAPKIMPEIDAILDDVRSNFDVAVLLHNDESRDVFKTLITERAQTPSSEFVLATSVAEVKELARRSQRKCIVYVSEESLPAGAGFMVRQMPPMPTFLPSLSLIVSYALREFRQESFIDVFDGKRMVHLKEVLRFAGLSATLDAIVKVAYFAGFEGNDSLADKTLREIVFLAKQNYLGVKKERMLLNRNEELFPGVGQVNRASPAIHAQNFFQQLLGSEQSPHAFAKLALSFYTVHGLGHSITKASRLLAVSRTTLHEHLRLAHACGMEKYFNFPSNSSRDRNFTG